MHTSISNVPLAAIPPECGHQCPRPQTRRRGGVGALALAAGFAFCAPLPANADAVTDWNEIAELTAMIAGAPPFQMRVMAMTQIAVHDAINSVDPRFTTYAGTVPAAPGAAPDAAVAAATFQVLRATVPLNPAQLEVLTDTYENRIDGLPECTSRFPHCIDDGIATGEAAAAAIIALRTNDGSSSPHLPYTLPPGPGVYQTTPPAYVGPLFAGWARLTPFSVNSGSQFHAPPAHLFDLRSKAYTRDYNEVKRVGALDAESSGDRTPDQSNIARFWPGGGANWNSVTRVIVAGRGLDAWEHARLFALLNMAMSDALVTVFDTKYTYNFWRPVTAIRAGESDGNAATLADPEWVPYQATPPYPDYTCGLTTLTGSAVEVLRRFLHSDDIAFTFTATFPPAVPPITRSYSSLSQAAAESVDARVFGGMHFRTGCVEGVKRGEQVGRFVVQRELKPPQNGGRG